MQTFYNDSCAACRWKFDPSNPTSRAAWNAFYNHLDQRVINSDPWNPQVIKGMLFTQ